MAVSNVSGMRFLTAAHGPDTTIGSRRVRDVSEQISLLDANNAALLTLLRKLRKKKSTDVKFEWHEDAFPSQTDTVSITSSLATSLTVTTAALWRAGDVWLNGDSGELIYVTARSSSTVTAIRGIGGTDATDIASADNWYYVGNGQETGDTARAQLTTEVDHKYNFCQLFKEAFEVTNTMNATKLYGGPDMTYLRMKHGDLHNRDIERALWFGAREDDALVTADDANITTGVYLTGGVFYWLSSNAATNTSTLTEDDFDGYLRTAFRYGNMTKFMFCSPVALSIISSYGRGKLQMVPRDNTYGINITRYISPHGELNLINNKLFSDFSAGDNVEYDKCSVILDMEHLWYRPLRDTMLEMNIQENDKDSMEDQYLTEAGLQVEQDKHHMEIFGWSQS